MFFVLIIHFRQFGGENLFFKFFKSCSESSEMKKKKLKKSSFPFTPSNRIRMKIFARIRIRKKNTDPKPWKKEWTVDFLFREPL